LSGASFELLAIEPLRLLGAKILGRKRRMSPYVWRNPSGDCSMLFRLVDGQVAATGSLWLARGNGCTFTLDPKPVLTPGPEDFDIGGCEDPTVVHVDEGCLVYYTGLDRDGVTQLLWAEGPDMRSLQKRGVAHASTASERNTKEATIERFGDGWLLLFEYGHAGRSRIGRGEANGPAGPWKETSDPLGRRDGCWDNWHLSTGPILIDEPGGPIMFYNGADADAVWQIGWAKLDETLARVISRCRSPLVEAPRCPDQSGRKMAFAASIVANEDQFWLYFTHDDRSLRRAIIRRSAS